MVHDEMGRDKCKRNNNNNNNNEKKNIYNCVRKKNLMM